MLMRFDPFRELDRLTEQVTGAARTGRSFPMDAYRRGDQFIVEFDLPGVDPGSVELTVDRNVLTIRAERRFEPRMERPDRERRVERWRRAVERSRGWARAR